MLSYEGHTLQTDYICLYVFDFEYQMCRKKEEILNPRLNTDTVLWWLQPTPEMGLASGFETYLTAYCSYQKKKKVKNQKHINKTDTSLCRGTRGWDRSMGNLHCTSPRDAKTNKHWVERTKLSTQLGSPYLGWLRKVRILTRDSDYNVFCFTILFTYGTIYFLISNLLLRREMSSTQTPS